MKYYIYSTLLLLFFSLSSAFAVDSNKPAYLIYNQDGDVVSYQSLVTHSMNSDMTFFGEIHGNTIAHWLQLEMIQDLSSDTLKSTTIGMEMFEADQQLLVDEYFSGHISQSSFENEARLWDNYSTDYKPIVEFAREHGLNLIATNIPRRYAASVATGGLDALENLSDEAKQWMMPLPVEVDTTLQSYQNMLEMAHGHGGMNYVYAQAVKDATMAHFILENFDENSRLFHVNGSYHSNDYEGIVWFIKEQMEDLNIVTINTITTEDVLNIDDEELQSADFTIVVPSTMTRTF